MPELNCHSWSHVEHVIIIELDIERIFHADSNESCLIAVASNYRSMCSYRRPNPASRAIDGYSTSMDRPWLDACRHRTMDSTQNFVVVVHPTAENANYDVWHCVWRMGKWK